MEKQNKQIIQLNIGQAGIRTGQETINLFAQEHQIDQEGVCKKNKITQEEKQNKDKQSNYEDIVFSEGKNGKFTARSLFIDTDDDNILDVRCDSLRRLYNQNNFVSTKEDSGNCYARGYYTIGKEIIDYTLDKIKKQVEECDNFQGFMVNMSIGGGTGSGLGSLILEELSAEYTKNVKLVFPIVPINYYVQPYNVLFSSGKLIDYSDINVAFDYSQIRNVCRNKLEIYKPGFYDFTQVVGKQISAVTTSLRFNGDINQNLDEMKKNLITSGESKNFIASSNSPFKISQGHFYKYYQETEKKKIYDTENITLELFDQDNQMVDCDLKTGKLLACNVLYRGDVVPKDVAKGFNKLKENKYINNENMCQQGTKLGINYNYPNIEKQYKQYEHSEREACMLANSTSIKSLFQKNYQQSSLMYRQRAYVHHYLNDGMEELEFTDQLNSLEQLISDYEEIEKL